MSDSRVVHGWLLVPGNAGELAGFAIRIQFAADALRGYADQWRQAEHLATAWHGRGGDACRAHLRAVQRYAAHQSSTSDYLSRAVRTFADELLAVQTAAAVLAVESEQLAHALGAAVLPTFMADYARQRLMANLRLQRLSHRAELLAQAFDRAGASAPPPGIGDGYPAWVAEAAPETFDSRQDEALARPAGTITDVLDPRPGKTDVTWDQIPLVVGATKDGWSQGTGIVVGPHEVLTNAHVVEGTSDIVVGETKLQADVVVYDKKHDVAVLKVPGLHVPPVPPADSMTPGEPVLIAGHPSGHMAINEGVVSDVGPYTMHPDNWNGFEPVVDAIVLKSGLGESMGGGASGGAYLTVDGKLAGELNGGGEADLKDGTTALVGTGNSIETLKPYIDKGLTATRPVPHGESR